MANFFDLSDLSDFYDIIILGAGPAGCSAGIYAARDGHTALILEKNFPGGNMAITEYVENYPGFVEPIMGSELAENFKAQAERYGAVIKQAEVKALRLKGKEKEIELANGKVLRAKAVILATGCYPKKIGAKNEDKFIGRGISFCATCDAGFFRNKEVVVVGGGDSALQEGLFLTKFASKVTIVHRRNEFRASKVLQERVRANEKIVLKTPFIVDEIIGENVISAVRLQNRESGEMEDYSTNGVFVFIGWNANVELFKDELELTDDNFIKAGEDTHTSVEGVFAAGDVRKKGLLQVVTAASDGAVAAKQAGAYIEEME